MNVRSLLAGLLLMAASSAAVASPDACLPVVEGGWIRAAPPGTTKLAGYATVRNACPGPMVIRGVSSTDFAMAMVHETLFQNGMSRMRHARSVVVPARGVLQFAPGGKHLMLMHPKRTLKPGDRVRVVLKLANGRRVVADLLVQGQPASNRGG